MEAAYVFGVRFRLDPGTAGVTVTPNEFETTLRRRADTPGEEGWRFFRDNCWRGELADEAHFRDLSEETLGVTVLSVEFEVLETDREYLDALRAAVGDDLDAFRADTVDEAITKYLGSSIQVVESG